MAEAGIPVPTLSETSAEEAVAPNTLGGWSQIQREYNQVLPLRLREMETVLQQADAVLAGHAR